MAKVLADFRTRLDLLLKDAVANLAQTDKDAALRQAAAFYSNDRPNLTVVDITGAGSFDLTLPDLWQEGFSKIKSVEYPYDADNQEAELLDRDQWAIYQNPTGKVLRLLDETPSASDTVRVTYTRQHKIASTLALTIAAAPGGAVRSNNVATITTTTDHGAAAGDTVSIAGVADTSFNGRFVVVATPSTKILTYLLTGANATSGGGTATLECTVPDVDFDAVAYLAAALAFEQLAALKIQTGDPTISADVVEYRTKSDQYRSMAKEMRGLYNQHLGKGAEVLPAAGVQNLDVDLSVGWDRLTHPRRTQ
jgi:hypothetical protein